MYVYVYTTTDTPAWIKHVLRESAPASATCVSPDLKYLVQALTEAQSNKDGTSKAATKQSSTSWQIVFARQGIDDATDKEVAIIASLTKSFFGTNDGKGPTQNDPHR